MTAFTTWSDAQAKYPDIIRVNSSVDPSSAYIHPAELRVNGYLSSRFTVPFSSNNDTAKDLVIDYAYGLIKGGKTFKDMKKDVLERMDELLEGKMDMMLEDGTAIPTVGGTMYSTTEDYHPTFGMGDSISFQVDSSRIESEEDARE